ncbi:MAG: hypothetical protein D6767_00620 [Candidatus Hydrogenedentota bacterium]|nr:MAG: hypothetical protein D6767_00620 [Candidatus Hydrogenedentota bacterium]
MSLCANLLLAHKQDASLPQSRIFAPIPHQIENLVRDVAKILFARVCATVVAQTLMFNNSNIILILYKSKLRYYKKAWAI